MNKKEKLEKIAAKVKTCKKCPLYKKTHNSVPGAGDPDANIFFIGEAPGYHEDQQGVPFVGRAGSFLDKLLASIDLQRENIFITNILKHRPPNNRDPKPEEIKACTPYLKYQLLTIKPQIVVTLGRFAMNYFVPDVYISKNHGRARRIKWEGLDLLLYPVYHPAAGLRRGSIKEATEKDFKKIPLIIEKMNEIAAEDKQEINKQIESEQTSLF
jgi:DNA polymerase